MAVIEPNIDYFMIKLLQVLIFPGILFFIILAFLYEWFDRKFKARIQRRRGPIMAGPFGILQPVADFIKLLGKEDVEPEAADKIGFRMTPYLELLVTFYVILFIPVISIKGIISLPGDLLFVLFVSTFFSIVIIFAGYFSGNRFALVGSERAGILFISYEIPLFISLITPAIIVGSLQIGEIVSFQAKHFSIPFLLIYLPLILPSYGLFLMSMLAKLEKVPFDVPEAKSEIIAGWLTEYTGKKLGMFHLSKNVQELFLLGLGTALFFGGPYPLPPFDTLLPEPFQPLMFLLWFIGKTLIGWLSLTFISLMMGRFRIEQARDFFWKYLTVLGIIQLAIVSLIVVLVKPFTFIGIVG